MTRTPLRVLAVALVLLLGLAACAGAGSRNPRDQMLYSYVSAIRWSEFDRAVAFIDPLVLAEDPVEPLELERLKLYQVSGYDVRTSSEPEEGKYLQVVEIRMVHRHTQEERVIIDNQEWRWDEEAGRWWLMSGLPDVAAR
jgi:hypothetical protein